MSRGITWAQKRAAALNKSTQEGPGNRAAQLHRLDRMAAEAEALGIENYHSMNIHSLFGEIINRRSSNDSKPLPNGKSIEQDR